MRVNATYGEAVPQQVHQFLEEQETLVVVSVDVLWSSDGQLDDEPGSKFDLCLHFFSFLFDYEMNQIVNTNGCCPVRHIQLL